MYFFLYFKFVLINSVALRQLFEAECRVLIDE